MKHVHVFTSTLPAGAPVQLEGGEEEGVLNLLNDSMTKKPNDSDPCFKTVTVDVNIFAEAHQSN